MIEPLHFFAALLIPLVIAGLIYAWWAHLHSRFTTVVRGRLYHSAAMRPSKLIRFVRQRRIDLVIDFRSGQDIAVGVEQRALASAGIRHVHLPTGIAPSAEEIRAFIDYLRNEVEPNARILMHCEDGEGRAVMFAAIYRIAFEGWSPHDAYLATARLPDGLRFISLIIPKAGCLSPKNVKTDLILRFGEEATSAQRGSS